MTLSLTISLSLYIYLSVYLCVSLTLSESIYLGLSIYEHLSLSLVIYYLWPYIHSSILLFLPLFLSTSLPLLYLLISLALNA